MSYLGLDLNSLVWEIKSLMKNNYGEDVTNENKELFFENAKRDILETFKDVIEQNKEEVFDELEDENN